MAWVSAVFFGQAIVGKDLSDESGADLEAPLGEYLGDRIPIEISLETRADDEGLNLGCRTFLSCISKEFGGFCSQLLRLRTGKLSSAFRLHGFADIF